MSDDLLHRPIHELAPLLRDRKVSPRELTRAMLARIERFQPTLNAYITVTPEQALKAAEAAEREIWAGKYRGPLHGIPLAIKDIFATRGVRTTAGSKVLADWVPDFDATAVARFRQAGAVLLGKTSTHEFAYGVTNDNPHYGAVHNPWDLKRVPGGSSGGSGTAVSASLCSGALGSDTGGSIRIPSACCGTVGIKPTYGRVSRHGAVPLAWSLDHVGPIAKSVEDAALLLAAIAGPDPQDPTASAAPVPDYRKALTGKLNGIRVGVPQQYFFERVDAQIKSAVERGLKTLEELGARLVEVATPGLEICSAMEAHITLAEATSYHEPHMKTKLDLYGERVRVNLEAGRYLLATDYVKSQRARVAVEQVFERAFRQADVLVSPTLPAFPPVIGEVWVDSGGTREHIIDAFLRFAIPFNLTGLPALTLPCGFSTEGLPIGMQIAGKAFDEATVLRVGHAYETATEWHQRRPALD